jgi:hypothetical protein
MRSAGIRCCGKQELAGCPVDLEFCPAVRVDDDLKERYDDFFFRFSGSFWLHWFLIH